MTARKSHITVCVCTYKRPVFLQRLLAELANQQIGADCTFSVVVADNDSSRSAQEVVAAALEHCEIEIDYCCEPVRNIALVRNRAIQQAKGEFIAFIDDDEFPVAGWLANLVQTCVHHGAAGVLGPVRPHFDRPPPDWIVRGRFCERPEHPTGTLMPWRECRTGNLLFRRSILPEGSPPFDEQFGTGGEDVDFFMRMSERGHQFVWCNEAVAYESVPASRMKRSYLLKRALLRGKNSLKISRGREVAAFKSIVAVPVYLLMLPFALLFGQHQLMDCSIRLCDHAGRLLALLGLSSETERQM